jgi:polyisoprenoid-binding protein YceI
MKRVLFLAAILLIPSPVWAAPRHFTLVEPDSRLSFAGQSPLHGFEASTTGMSGSVEADWDADRLLGDGFVRIPVDSLKSGNQARDHAVQFTLRAAKNPQAEYFLKTAVKTGEEAGGWRRYRLSGEIRLGGVAKPLEMDVRARLEGDRLRVEGQADLTMSGFGLKPPPLARFMGLKDAVHVDWQALWAAEAAHG